MIKLLYIWMGEGDTNFIENTGFNLSVEYRFVMTAENEQYRLTCEQLGTQDFWGDQGNIVGLTAVVGENGTGKTTLFRSIYSNSLFPEEQEDREDYRRYIEERNRKGRCLLAYVFSNQVKIFHNLNTLTNDTGFEATNLNELSFEQLQETMDLLEQQTRIYFTNSNYAEGMTGSMTHGRLNGICLTPGGLNTIAKMFFQRVSCRSVRDFESPRFYYVQDRICSCKTPQDFQAICDICYLRSIDQVEQPTQPVIRAKKGGLHVSFSDMAGMLRRQDGFTYLGSEEFRSTDKMDTELSAYVNRYVRVFAPLPGRLEPLCVLCSAVLFELCFVCELSIPERMPTTLEAWIDDLERKYEEFEGRENASEKLATYYCTGIREVITLCDILKECACETNYLPAYDLGYTNTIFIDPDTATYSQFFDAVDSFARAESSIVLKYIVISGLTRSSGERALQNLFSWLMLPPHFEEYLAAENIPLRDNVLLMIDELDLYMHPEWQRLSIKELSSQLKKQYSGKNIQLLIATHSPLILSDIPAENCIFLKGGEDRITFADCTPMIQTFGANIHDLLNHSFFLNNTMGEFAYETIRQIAADLEKLKQLAYKRDAENRDHLEEVQARCRSYRDVIDHIGEPLIRHKLLGLYHECYLDQAELFDRLRQIPSELGEGQKELLRAELRHALERLGEP